MASRRQFLKWAGGFLTGVGLVIHPFWRGICLVFAQVKKILPKGTPREALIDENPAHLDTRNLEITPLDGFGTMGLTNHRVSLDRWRLHLTGHVANPVALRYSQLLELPAVERNVLLICPGFFANQGRWKGISMKALIREAGMKDGVTQVTFYGPAGTYEKVQTYPLQDILSDRVFLAYEVNGTPLPIRHGYPLRLVAEGYYGFDWIKYVYKVRFERVEESRKESPE